MLLQEFGKREGIVGECAHKVLEGLAWETYHDL